MNVLKQHAPSLLAVGVLGLLAMAACSTAPERPEARDDLNRASAEALGQAIAHDPSLLKVIQNSASYVIFPAVGKSGGTYAKGDLFQYGALMGYCEVKQGSLGLPLGGRAYSEIIVFLTGDAADAFKKGSLRFDAQTTAVTVKAGAAASAPFTNGVAVFTMDEAGVLREATVEGQEFSYQARKSLAAE